MAKRLRDAGFPESDVQVLGPNDRKKNMVARLRGTGKRKPVLLIGHLDVVEARREDWSTDPFKFVEKDGFYYGRGTQDMKGGDAIMVTTLIRMKKEGYKPDRDIILALTADEEGGKSNGVDWLLKNHRDLIDAEFVLNHDGGGITSDNGKPVMMDVDATEKALRRLPADGDQSRRAQFPAGARQRDLPSGERTGTPGALRVPDRPEQRHACVLRAHVEGGEGSARRGHEGDSRRILQIRRRSTGCPRMRLITRKCGRLAWPRAWKLDTPTTPCRRWRKPT